MIVSIRSGVPQTQDAAFVAPNCTLAGKVILGSQASVWYGAVLRADAAQIRVGSKSNIQDNVVIHVDEGQPCVVGNCVTVGHSAVLHSCTVGDNCVVGMGAVVLNGAVIGSDCIIGAGALVTKNTVIPSGSLVIGSPAAVRRPLTDAEKADLVRDANIYVSLAKEHLEGLQA